MTVYAITGASRGLGLGYTKGLLEQSADNLVIALVRDPAGAKELQGLTAQYSNRLVIVKHDLTEQSAEAAVKEVERLEIAKNGLDVLINNAGVNVGPTKTVLDEGFVDDFNANMSVNFFGVVHTTSAFLPLLRRGSKKQIILLSSGLASIKMDFGFGPAISAYSISKTALNGYARKLSDAIKPEGFTVIPFSPGYVLTDMNTGSGALGAITVEQATADALRVWSTLTVEDNMKFYANDGSVYDF